MRQEHPVLFLLAILPLQRPLDDGLFQPPEGPADLQPRHLLRDSVRSRRPELRIFLRAFRQRVSRQDERVPVDRPRDFGKRCDYGRLEHLLERLPG